MAAKATLTVRVTPRSSSGKCQWNPVEKVLHLSVPSAPVDGEANEAVLKTLSKRLGLPTGRFSLTKGHKSRVKIFSVDGIEQVELEELIGRL